jgi:hypothetical protein
VIERAEAELEAGLAHPEPREPAPGAPGTT